MDKQTINIPVNTRIVGDAKHIFEGIYVLYLEDYVHTFIKKLLYEQELDDMDDVSVYMYGSSFEQDAQNIMVVSGAVAAEHAQYNDFPKEMLLCTALVKRNKDKGIRFELSINGTKVILDDFYIYYDQNEAMQNYLIAWNGKKQEQQTTKTGVRIPVDNAARLGRIAQAYNRESARVSLVWGAMNVLSLSLVVCVIAYGIISINSYGKMQSMQESIDYCMALVSENVEKTTQSEAEMRGETVAVVNQLSEQIVETSTQKMSEQSAEPLAESPVEQPDEMSVPQPVEETALQKEPENVQPVQNMNPSVPQYYVVQRGDTLGNICKTIYGDYSRMEEICALNSLENPDNILYGQKLLLP